MLRSIYVAEGTAGHYSSPRSVHHKHDCHASNGNHSTDSNVLAYIPTRTYPGHVCFVQILYLAFVSMGDDEEVTGDDGSPFADQMHMNTTTHRA